MGDQLLTIVVPAYNVEKYVGQCLESLVRQTCDRFSVIIVDDGSTDENTSEICRTYAQRYPERFKYVHQENKGLGAARNTGMRLVKTPFVGFLDSDDWLCTRYVERLIAELEKYDDDGIDLVFTLPVIYDSLNGQMSDWMDKGTFEWIFPEQSRVVEMGIDKRLLRMEPNACRRVYRMSFLERCHFKFPEATRWEDVYPHFYLLSQARKVLGIPDVGFYYRTNVPTSITASGGKSRLEVVSVFKKTLDYLLAGDFDVYTINSALKMCVSFSTWSVLVSKDKVRHELVDKLHELYVSIPKNCMDAFFAEKGIMSYEQEQFVKIMLRKHMYKAMYDYQAELIARKIMDKLGK